jgi:DHA2 family multidrug resistance protein-like MFS transporter
MTWEAGDLPAVENTNRDAPIAPRAGRREWVGLAVIALPCLIYAMDFSVLALAVPSLTQDLRPTGIELVWINDIYGFVIAALLITMGSLGDRIGRRRLLMIGAAGFTVASVLAAFSTSPEMLIGSRALLGVAGATLAPSTLALISNMFGDPVERTKAIGIWIASFSVGAAVGPLLGGVLLEWFWWGSVFLLAVPAMALLLLIGPRLLPEFRNPNAGRGDPLSALLLLVALLTLIYAVKEVTRAGWGWLPVVLVAVSVTLGTTFVRRQLTAAEPLVNLRLLRRPAFSAALVINAVGFFAVFGISFLTAQYLQLILRLSPLQAGLWTLPSAAAFVIGSMLTPIAVRWARPATVVVAGLLTGVLGFAVLAGVPATSGLATLVSGSVIFSLGLAAVFTLATDLMVSNALPEQAGSASAIAETSSELGGAFGIAILGSVGTAIYRREVELPLGGAWQDGTAAGETFAGALAATGGLPHDLATDLVTSGGAAFTHGLQVAAGITAVALGLAAVAGLLVLRRASGGGLAHRPIGRHSTSEGAVPPLAADGAPAAGWPPTTSRESPT